MALQNIHINHARQVTPDRLPVEVVERKGIGHPDSLSDGIAESISRTLSRQYLKLTGHILHHNTDQVEVVGGAAKPVFGGGKLTRPILVFISGRATDMAEGEEIDVTDIASKVSQEYLAETLPNLDPSKHIKTESRIGRSSVELTELFKRKQTHPLANDTSIGTGFYPLTETEKLTFQTEQALNSHDLKREYPEIGQDIKVMALRQKNKILLTIAAAAVSRYLDDIEQYKDAISMVKEETLELARTITKKKLEVEVNLADDYSSGSIYLTVTGTSAEMGDDGSVGRGNRANGLITPYRSMSIEAASGKNPCTHTGKLYNLLAKDIAKEIVETLPVQSSNVLLLSQIGKRIDQPLQADISLSSKSKPSRAMMSKARKITNDRLSSIPELTDKLVRGHVETF